MTSLQPPFAAAAQSRLVVGQRTSIDGRQGIHTIVWRPGLLEQIRSYAASTYISRSGKGDDVGGIFFGNCEEGEINVMAWRPIGRGQEATSHFYLEPREERKFARMLETYSQDEKLEELEILGWFRSRTKGETVLEEHDIQFHEKYFSDPGHFVMIVRPSHQRPAAAAFYLRNNDGQFESTVPSARLSLLPGPMLSPVEEEEQEAPQRRGKFSWPLLLSMLALIATVSCAAIFAMQWNDAREEAKQSQTLNFQLIFNGDELKATWDSHTSAILAADSAQLHLGGERLQLSHAELVQGFLRIPLSSKISDDMEVIFKVGNREEVAQLILAPKIKNLSY